MGFCSDLAAGRADRDLELDRRSFAEERLRTRLAELESRRSELTDSPRPYAYSHGSLLLPEELRYALPEDLHTACDVEAAIELVKKALTEKNRRAVPAAQKDRGPLPARAA